MILFYDYNAIQWLQEGSNDYNGIDGLLPLSPLVSRNSCTRWIPGSCRHTHKCSLLICQYLLSGGIIVVTSHPGTQRLQGFLLTQGAMLWSLPPLCYECSHVAWYTGLHTQKVLPLWKYHCCLHIQGEGYPDPSAFCNNVGHVLAKEIYFILSKHKIQSKLFTSLHDGKAVFTKYEADLLCQNITYITTKDRGVRVSHPVYMHFAW